MKRRKHSLGENIFSAIIGGVLALLVAIFGLIPAWTKQDEKPIEVRQEITTTPELEAEDSIPEEEESTETVEKTEYLTEAVIDVPQVQNVSYSVSTDSNEEPYFPYTDTDIYLVGNTVFNEVGVFFEELSEEEAERAAYLTASCLVNRAKMNYLGLGTKIADQVYSNQYESREKVTSVKEDYVYDRIYEIAEDVLKNGPVVSEKLIFQSEKKQGEVIETIGNQFFGILPETWE